MITFLIGLAILIIAGFVYGAFCNKVFGPDDRQTPAYKKQDGVDYVPMPLWKTSLIQLLNIAGTGPILGPIQGILFGPIAFILIPIGCVFGGAMHDFFSGMISLREEGDQMPSLIKKYLGKGIFVFYNIFLCLLLFLVVAVFVTTPGDLIATQLLNIQAVVSNPLLWVIYGLIFVYYLIAALFPIDKIIGRIYPVFGMILLISAVGVFFGLFFKGYPLENLSLANFKGIHPDGIPILPIFFVTVACGIVSGFHSTQSTMIGRSLQSEREGRTVFFNMMLVEGFIAMIWAAAAMGAYTLFQEVIGAESIGPTGMIGLISRDMLGPVGGILAILGVVVLPISTGDTALRSLRLIIGDVLHIDQTKKKNRLLLSLVLCAIVLAILIFSKLNANGFNILWRYFAWSNQTVAIFAFATITIYLLLAKKPYWIALIPGAFYTFIISAYIINAPIGFGLSMNVSYILAVILAVAYCVAILIAGKKKLAEAKASLPSQKAQ